MENLRGGLGIAAGHLGVGLLIRDQSVGLAFAARAGGGRYGDQRQHRLARLARAPVVLHAAAIGENEVAALRGVHAAASAQPHDQIDVGLPRDGEAALDAAGGRVLLRVVEARDGLPGQLQRLVNAFGMSGGHDALIRDQQDFGARQVPRQLADSIHGAGAKDQTRARLMIEGDQMKMIRQMGSVIRLRCRVSRGRRVWVGYSFTHDWLGDAVDSDGAFRRLLFNGRGALRGSRISRRLRQSSSPWRRRAAPRPRRPRGNPRPDGVRMASSRSRKRGMNSSWVRVVSSTRPQAP